MKFKKALWLFAGLATNLSLASFIATSCGHNEQKPIDDPLNYDQKFGFNDATYTKLEDNLRKELDLKIRYDEKYRKQGESQSQWDKKIDELGGHDQIMDQLENNLSCFRNEFFGVNGEYRENSFNTKTESLINFAKQNYGIMLYRPIIETSFLEEIQEIKSAYKDYLKQALENVSKDNPEEAKKIEKKLSEFDEKFDEYFVAAKKTSIDKIQVISQLRLNFIDYFSGVNNELSQLAAQNQLKQFLNTYKFTANIEKIKSNGLYWDALVNNSSYNPNLNESNKTPKIMSSIIDKAFDIVKVVDSSIFANESYESLSWKDLAIPGYKLTPCIIDLLSNAFDNQYTVNLDWQLVNENVYKDVLAKYNNDETNENFLKEIDTFTAHSYYSEEKTAELFPQLDSVSHKNASKNTECFCSYQWPVSVQYSKEALFNTFVQSKNDDSSGKENKITFSWLNDKNLTGFDSFVSKEALDDSTNVVHADLDKLTYSGLQINGRPIYDLRKEMETNTSEEIEKDPAKLCLKYCDLTGEYDFDNLSDGDISNVDVNVALKLSYKNNNFKEDVSCNPVASSLDTSEQNKTIEVDHEILNRASLAMYESFTVHFKSVKECLDLNELNETISKAETVAASLLVVVVVLQISLAVILTFCYLRYNKAISIAGNMYSNTARTLMQILLIAIAFLAFASILFTVVYLARLKDFKTKISKFLANDKSEYVFAKKMAQYEQYYSDLNEETGEILNKKNKDNFDKFMNEKLNKNDYKGFYGVVCYFADFENNKDFQDYKQARIKADVWDINYSVFSLDFKCAIFSLLIAIVLALFVLYLIMFSCYKVTVDEPIADFSDKCSNSTCTDPDEISNQIAFRKQNLQFVEDEWQNVYLDKETHEMIGYDLLNDKQVLHVKTIAPESLTKLESKIFNKNYAFLEEKPIDPAPKETKFMDKIFGMFRNWRK